ncbi:MAG: ArsR family transcriptional regulator [Candidatus Nanoarchaeia archaeon]|nr:ArsR family transcriptional regulator [Candidatus Nanoarchaeia archaeon]
MYILDNRLEGNYLLDTKEIKLKNLKSLSSTLSQKILENLENKPMYPKELAKKLKENEQKIYYHIKNLEKSGFIKILKTQNIHGALANIYCSTQDSFFFKFKDLKLAQKISTKENQNDYLKPFILDGKLNCLIIVGSPDPHGPDKARSKDGYYGMDFALFLGIHLNYIPNLNVKLDTETRQEDLENNNLIILGGPITNRVMAKFNDKLPIRFEQGNNIRSTISSTTYHNDENGMIVRISNPFNKEKKILIVAGKRHSGTRASIIAFLKHFNEICIGNKYNEKIYAKVVEGLDLNSDGVVDDVDFVE